MNVSLILSIFEKLYLLFQMGVKYEEVVREFNTKAETMDEEALDAWLDQMVQTEMEKTQTVIDEAKAVETPKQ